MPALLGVALVCGGLLGCGTGGSKGSDDSGATQPPIVAVTPSQATVAKNQTMAFAAIVVGAGPGVSWSVDGGAANGTVDAQGLYKAPSALPDAPVVVRATSTDDRLGTGSAIVKVTVGGELTVDPNQPLSPDTATANTFSGGQRSVAVFGETVYFVWHDNRRGHDDVYVAVSRNGGATIGSATRVNDDTEMAAQRDPSIALDGSGRAVVAWMDARHDPLAPGFDVYVATVTVDGGGTVSVGQNQRVTASGPICYPTGGANQAVCDASMALALDRLGNAYLAWADGSSGSDTDIRLTKGARLPSGQFNFSQNVQANESFNAAQSRPSLAVDDQENVLVAWNDPRFDGQDVYWRTGRFTVTGGIEWATGDVRVNLETVGDQVSPSVAVGPSGTAYIAWSQQIGDERRKLYFAKSDSSDLAVAMNTPVLDPNPAISSDQNFPSLAVAGFEVTIAFADNHRCKELDPSAPCGFDPLNQNGTGPTDIYVVRSLDGGETFPEAILVNDDDQSLLKLHGRPSVALDDLGRVYAIWTDDRQGSSQAFMARVD